MAAWLLTLGAAVPLALLIREGLATHLGSSLMSDTLATGMDYEWWQEFASQARGVDTSFTANIIGFGTTLDAWSRLLDAREVPVAVATALGTYLTAWTVLAGGVVARYGRPPLTGPHGFAEACGRHAGVLVRLALLAGAAYAFLFGTVHEWLFDTWYTRITRDVDVESTVFAWRALFYGVFGLLLAAVATALDYARVRIVVENRRSALMALVAACRFIRRHPGRVAGLWSLNGLAALMTMGVWAVVSHTDNGWAVGGWRGVVAAQAYLALRLTLRLVSLASTTAVFQASLAQVGYPAARVAGPPSSR
jgi:hypothetical protein